MDTFRDVLLFLHKVQSRNHVYNPCAQKLYEDLKLTINSPGEICHVNISVPMGFGGRQIAAT